MKKELITLIAFLVGISVFGEERPDSLKQVNLDEIIVSASRVIKKTPIAYSNLTETEIKETNAGKNIPYILQTLPSIVSFSEDGSGIGNTSLRIRGTDATRINVTLNDMPLNNPESQEVYWVNIPDISNSLQNIQVQRGVGSSTNGAAAFGASISLRTFALKTKAYGESSIAIGNYNTITSTLTAGTGILKNGLSFDARYSRITADGYISNGKVNHKNAYISSSYINESQLIRLLYINGIQHTGITWEGISPEQMKEDRKYNPAGEYYDDAGNKHYYDNETDNYYSNIVQLTYSNQINEFYKLNAGLSYNHGYGYYENYKMDQKFSKFGLIPQTIDKVTYPSSDIVRRKAMKNNFYVANVNLNYNKQKVNIIGGLSFTRYNGDHYGQLRWVKYNENIPAKYEWYLNDAKKTDFSLFTKVLYEITPEFSLFGDLQYRYVDYRMDGFDDDLESITNKKYFSFFNPKAGATYNINGHEVYASFAVANREPLRTDIKESVKGGSIQKIKPERLFDYEFGYKYSGSSVFFNANLYYMYYKDQMIQTGKLNDVGYKLMENVPVSYRYGIELIGSYIFSKWVKMDANITFSSNKIKKYTAYYDLYDPEWNLEGQTSEYLGKTDISFSPGIVGSGVLTFTPGDFTFNITGKYIGKQFYDNTSNKDNRLPDYFIANLVAGYSIPVKKIGEINLQLFINNLLNKHYVANAWVATDKFTDGKEAVYTGLYPQATRNIMAKIGIKF